MAAGGPHGPAVAEEQNGPGRCLTDPDELVSRWTLFDCIRAAEEE
jgi:hypothetical protein